MVFGFFQTDNFLLDFYPLRNERILQFFELINIQGAFGEGIVDSIQTGFEGKKIASALPPDVGDGIGEIVGLKFSTRPMKSCGRRNSSQGILLIKSAEN